MPALDAAKGKELRLQAEQLIEAGEADEALNKASEARELLKDGGDAEEVAGLCALASALLLKGRPWLSLDSGKEAAALAARLGDKQARAKALSAVLDAFLAKKEPEDETSKKSVEAQAAFRDLSHKKGEASILSAVATAHLYRRRQGDALEAAAQALKLARNPAHDADHFSLGVENYLAAQAPDDAQKAVDESLTLFRELGDRRGEGRALYLSGSLRAIQRDRTFVDSFLTHLREIQQIYKEAGAKREEEGVLDDIISFHLGKFEKDEAARVKDEVLALYESDKKESLAALLRVASAHSQGGALEEARKFVAEALAKARELGDKDIEVAALMGTIDVHLAKRETDDAVQVADQIVGLVASAKKKAKAMYVMAQIQFGKDGGQHEALAALKRARGFYKEAGEVGGEVEVLQTLAEIHLGLNENSEGLVAAREALAVAQAAGHKALEARLLQTVVSANLARDSETDAMKAASEALARSRDLGDAVGEISALLSVAQIHLTRGQPAAAGEAAAELLSLCRAQRHLSGEASASLILANAMLTTDSGNVEALQFARDAAALFSELGDIYGAQSALHSLANGYFARGDLEEGLKYAREALACFRQTGDRTNEEILKQTIGHARLVTAEMRKQTPKRALPLSAGAGQPLASGPEACPITESKVPDNLLDLATAGRKYWGVPKHQEPDLAQDAFERAPSHVLVWGYNLSDNSPTQVCIEFGDLVACMSKGDVSKIPIVVQTRGVNARMIGEMAPPHFSDVAAVTMWGMARTVRQEIPAVSITLLDFSEAQTTAQIPRALRPPAPYVLESAYYNRARWEPQIAAVPSLFRRDLKKDTVTSGNMGAASETKKSTKFMRKAFNWTGPSHKLDYCWYRQEWRAVGPAEGDIGLLPPPPPCRALRTR